MSEAQSRMNPIDDVVVYCGSPDISTHVPAGYSTHLLGVINGFERCGLEVRTVIMGNDSHVSAVSTSTNAPSETSTPRAFGKSIGRARALLPEKIWNSVRDLRDIVADRRGRMRLEGEVGTSTTIYERFIPLHGSAAQLAKARDLRYVLEVNSPLIERAEFGRSSPLDRVVERRLVASIRAADVVVFVSTILLEDYERSLGFEIANAVVIPNAVSPHIPSAQTSEDAQNVVPLGAPLLAFVGTMIPWHRVDILLESFQRILADYPTAHLLMIGDGELRPEYEAMADSLDLASSTTFTGSLDRSIVLEVLKSVQIALMTASNWYGSPVKIFEYAQAGCAIIGPRTGPVEETFDEGTEILLVGPEIDDVAAALRVLCGDPERARTMGLRAQERVENEYTWEVVAQKVLEALDSSGK